MNSIIDQNEQAVIVWESHLRRFIDLATRHSVKGLHDEAQNRIKGLEKLKNNPDRQSDYYKAIEKFNAFGEFWPYVDNARELFEHFKIGIKNQLAAANNPGAIESDIKRRFCSDIEKYTIWYNEHEKETEIFEQYNPYRLMMDLIESTQQIIDSYFPDEHNITEPPDQRLKHSQIALIYAYNEIPITEENAGEIAVKYKWTAKTSGKSIYDEFVKYRNPTDRKGIPKSPSPTKMKNKIKLLESVLPYLTNTGLERATAEINILESIPESEY